MELNVCGYCVYRNEIHCVSKNSLLKIQEMIETDIVV